MWWMIVIAWQGAMQTAAGPPDVRSKAPSTAAPARCPETQGDDIVVCARDPETFRLRPLPQGFEPDGRLPTASTTILGMGVAVEAEAGQAIGGAPPRAMLRLKLPF